MALLNVNAGSKFLINGQNTYCLSVATDRTTATYVIHLVSSTFNGSVTVKARSAAAIADNATPLPVNYLKTYVNGAVGDQTYGNAALTGTSLIIVPATGQQIVLDCTAYTSGTLTAYCTLATGAAA